MEQPSAHYTYTNPPTVIDRKKWREGNILWSLLIGLIVVLIELIALVSFDMTGAGASLLGMILVLFYSIVLFFLLEPHILREITHMQVRTIEKPVVSEVVKEVVRTVERPVIREVYRDRPIERKVYVPVVQQRAKLNIPKYKYFGSDDTLIYHQRNCRFRKLIKRKNQEVSNSEAYFRKKKYSPCKVCITKEKKV